MSENPKAPAAPKAEPKVGPVVALNNTWSILELPITASMPKGKRLLPSTDNLLPAKYWEEIKGREDIQAMMRPVNLSHPTLGDHRGPQITVFEAGTNPEPTSMPISLMSYVLPVKVEIVKATTDRKALERWRTEARQDASVIQACKDRLAALELADG
jgi:hypothetical protein